MYTNQIVWKVSLPVLVMTGFCLPVDRTENAKFRKEVTTVHDSEFPNIRLWILCV